MRACLAILVLVIVALPVGSAPVTTEIGKKEPVSSSARLLFSDCENSGDLRLLDITSADEATRAWYLDDLQQCRYDGLVIHGSGENSCNDIVKCSESVEKTCKKKKSFAEIARVGNGQCTGTCANGTKVTINCA